MRKITNAENDKRGCSFCTDKVRLKTKEDDKAYLKFNIFCIHDDGCPYHELDPYETYVDYLKATEKNLNLPT